LERILRTLHNHDVAIQKKDGLTRLEKGDVLETALFTPIIPRWIIQRLARLFDIELTDFYEIPPIPGDFFKEDDDPLDP
jgi:hypothetical protein